MSNNNLPKILLATPTSEHKDYCMPQWIEHIKSLTYPNLDILIVDNSKNPKYYKKIQQQLGDKGKVIHHNFDEKKELREIMCECNNIIRDYAIGNNYMYVFSLESDVFVPVNTIEYLLHLDKPMISLPYFIGQSFNSALLVSGYEPVGKERESVLMNRGLVFYNFNGSVAKEYQTGIGAVLIHQHYLRKVKFRIDKNIKTSHADAFFMQDLFNAGYPVFTVRKYIAYHQNGSWGDIFKTGRDKTINAVMTIPIPPPIDYDYEKSLQKESLRLMKAELKIAKGKKEPLGYKNADRKLHILALQHHLNKIQGKKSDVSWQDIRKILQNKIKSIDRLLLSNKRFSDFRKAEMKFIRMYAKLQIKNEALQITGDHLNREEYFKSLWEQYEAVVLDINGTPNPEDKINLLQKKYELVVALANFGEIVILTQKDKPETKYYIKSKNVFAENSVTENMRQLMSIEEEILSILQEYELDITEEIDFLNNKIMQFYYSAHIKFLQDLIDKRGGKEKDFSFDYATKEHARKKIDNIIKHLEDRLLYYIRRKLIFYEDVKANWKGNKVMQYEADKNIYELKQEIRAKEEYLKAFKLRENIYLKDENMFKNRKSFGVGIKN